MMPSISESLDNNWYAMRTCVALLLFKLTGTLNYMGIKLNELLNRICIEFVNFASITLPYYPGFKTVNSISYLYFSCTPLLQTLANTDTKSQPRECPR